MFVYIYTPVAARAAGTARAARAARARTWSPSFGREDKSYTFVLRTDRYFSRLVREGSRRDF